MRRAPTRRKSKPGRMKRSVRPSRGAPRASVSRTRTVVVPTARTRSAAFDSRPRFRRHRVALAVERMVLDVLDRERAERVEADVQRHPLDVERSKQLGREVEARRGRCRRALRRRVDRLIALRIRERLVNVGRQRRLTRRVAVEPKPPTPLAEMLEQLDRAVSLPGAQAPRRTRKPLPHAAAEPLEQQHLAARPLDRDPPRHDPRVVHDRERPRRQEPGQVAERRMPHLAVATGEDKQPRGIPALQRTLRNQLFGKFVVELTCFHPTATLPSSPWKIATPSHLTSRPPSTGRASRSRRSHRRPTSSRSSSRTRSAAR